MYDDSLLKQPPFSLDDEALSWVKDTFESLNARERITQLFCFRSDGDRPGEFEHLMSFKPGGIIRIMGTDRDKERARIDALQQASDVPMLISADLEGSRMSLNYGTPVPNPLALAAIDDLETTAEVAKILAREGQDTGINWSYTPVLDINHAWRSPIVATRGFGSDPDCILRHSLAQIEAFQANGVAATIKHWPGEGYDDRDQHLMTTINPLSIEEWHRTFGRLYKECIDAGALSVMSAHIAFPAYAERSGETGAELYRPASISRHLNLSLLRGELGFNGVIVSDASEMAGITSFVPSPQSKVEILKGGCDMILMSSNPEAEISAVEHALKTGELNAKELDMSLLRLLGLKAKLGLHQPKPSPVVDYAAHKAQAKAIHHRAPTLVKDTQNLLPLDRLKHNRITIVTSGIVEPLQGKSLDFIFPNLLRDEGFDVTMQPKAEPIDTDAADLVLYLLGEETLLTRGHIFLDWARLTENFRASMQRTWHHVPTAMISFGYPYFLYGAPRMPTYINAYATMDDMQHAVLDLMLGRREWNTSSPIDPFAGAPDARY